MWLGPVTGPVADGNPGTEVSTVVLVRASVLSGPLQQKLVVVMTLQVWRLKKTPPRHSVKTLLPSSLRLSPSVRKTLASPCANEHLGSRKKPPVIRRATASLLGMCRLLAAVSS